MEVFLWKASDRCFLISVLHSHKVHLCEYTAGHAKNNGPRKETCFYTAPAQSMSTPFSSASGQEANVQKQSESCYLDVLKKLPDRLDRPVCLHSSVLPLIVTPTRCFDRKDEACVNILLGPSPSTLMDFLDIFLSFAEHSINLIHTETSASF